MARIYLATLTPSKLDLLAAWLPGRPWAGDLTGLSQLGAFRFDDPAGAVGIETFLLSAAGGTVLQVPMTYRDAPLDGAGEHLIGTTDHSVLGKRWVYDGCGDPVWVAATAAAVLAGEPQAEELTDRDGALVAREPTATATGSGTPGTEVPIPGPVSARDGDRTTTVSAGPLEVVLARVVGTPLTAPQTLTGRWPGGGPAILAGVRVVS
jgi:hypothetical protein